jgi:CDP-glucose 4,6-dehydratase
MVSVPFQQFYAGKRVLVTGHTGFKGAWLSLWLKKLGARVWGYGLESPTQPSFYELINSTVFEGETIQDIRDGHAMEATLKAHAPDVVFHLAAQALVRRSYEIPLETFAVNTVGTACLLDAIRRLELPSTVIVVTSDKCYENQGWEFGYRENDPLGGGDIYSMSKAATELVVQSWRRSFFQRNPKLGAISTVRAGNVIGGGDYAQDRLLPDCIRALLDYRPISVRNPGSTRPWQHVLDCLSGYLWLGARLAKAGKASPFEGAFNFGPGLQSNRSVMDLVTEILNVWPGEWLDASDPQAPQEAKFLHLSIDKAVQTLPWHPNWGFTEAVHQSISWYHQRHVAHDTRMAQFSMAQIDSYCLAAQAKKMPWSV